MHAVVAALRAHDVQPALEWARANREALSRAAEAGGGGGVEWQLHRLRFLTLLRQAREGLVCACGACLTILRRRAELQRCSTRACTLADSQAPRRCAPIGLCRHAGFRADCSASQAADVRRLMGCLLFAERFDESPYAVRGGAHPT